MISAIKFLSSFVWLFFAYDLIFNGFHIVADSKVSMWLVVIIFLMQFIDDILDWYKDRINKG